MLMSSLPFTPPPPMDAYLPLISGEKQARLPANFSVEIRINPWALLQLLGFDRPDFALGGVWDSIRVIPEVKRRPRTRVANLLAIVC